ncbi:hypothetical protein MMC21_008275 [Puttea exsequens]|nr:hypothetical protein [Puttea exsequens]
MTLKSVTTSAVVEPWIKLKQDSPPTTIGSMASRSHGTEFQQASTGRVTPLRSNGTSATSTGKLFGQGPHTPQLDSSHARPVPHSYRLPKGVDRLVARIDELQENVASIKEALYSGLQPPKSYVSEDIALLTEIVSKFSAKVGEIDTLKFEIKMTQQRLKRLEDSMNARTKDPSTTRHVTDEGAHLLATPRQPSRSQSLSRKPNHLSRSERGHMLATSTGTLSEPVSLPRIQAFPYKFLSTTHEPDWKSERPLSKVYSGYRDTCNQRQGFEEPDPLDEADAAFQTFSTPQKAVTSNRGSRRSFTPSKAQSDFKSNMPPPPLPSVQLSKLTKGSNGDTFEVQRLTLSTPDSEPLVVETQPNVFPPSTNSEGQDSEFGINRTEPAAGKIEVPQAVLVTTSTQDRIDHDIRSRPPGRPYQADQPTNEESGEENKRRKTAHDNSTIVDDGGSNDSTFGLENRALRPTSRSFHGSGHPRIIRDAKSVLYRSDGKVDGRSLRYLKTPRRGRPSRARGA